jgi:hypothetical protein
VRRNAAFACLAAAFEAEAGSVFSARQEGTGAEIANFRESVFRIHLNLQDLANIDRLDNRSCFPKWNAVEGRKGGCQDFKEQALDSA